MSCPRGHICSIFEVVTPQFTSGEAVIATITQHSGCPGDKLGSWPENEARTLIYVTRETRPPVFIHITSNIMKLL